MKSAGYMQEQGQNCPSRSDHHDSGRLPPTGIPAMRPAPVPVPAAMAVDQNWVHDLVSAGAVKMPSTAYSLGLLGVD